MKLICDEKNTLYNNNISIETNKNEYHQQI